MKLFVDDERECPEGWTAARTYADAIAVMEACSCQFDAISIDHDLGDGPSGYDVATWLEQRQANGFYVPADITCHSADHDDHARIERCLASIRRMQESER